MPVRGQPRQSFIGTHTKTASASFKQLLTRPLGNLLTLAVIALSLAIPTSLYLVAKNTTAIASGVAQPSVINVYLQEGSAESRVMLLKDQIERIDHVDEVEYVSAQQGLDELSQYAGFEQALSLLDEYALPAVLVVKPASDQPDAIRDLLAQIQTMDNVADLQLNEDWLERFDALKNLVSTVSFTMAVLLLVAVILTVGNSVRYSVLAQKEEIQVMKLIGATDSFIVRPYLYIGMWYGLIGAIAAWLVTALLTIVLSQAVEMLATLYDTPFRLVGLGWDESLILLLLGSFLGLFAASVSTRRHLKEIEPV
jgi:cell division transport system permease protein